MVRVTIKTEKYDRIEFDFVDCEVAGKFLKVAMEAAVDNVKVEIEKVAEAGQPEEPETRFLELGSAPEAPELF